MILKKNNSVLNVAGEIVALHFIVVPFIATKIVLKWVI